MYAEKVFISIHALRGEGDRGFRRWRRVNRYFNPRPPWGGRLWLLERSIVKRDFNPRPPWGGRHRKARNRPQRRNFNPRPPWGGRQGWACRPPTATQISIHALRGEGDAALSAYRYCGDEFQSTPSVGRATCEHRFGTCPNSKISIHALRGEGDALGGGGGASTAISIHALRGEGDLKAALLRQPGALISIHALRGEGDVAKVAGL